MARVEDRSEVCADRQTIYKLCAKHVVIDHAALHLTPTRHASNLVLCKLQAGLFVIDRNEDCIEMRRKGRQVSRTFLNIFGEGTCICQGPRPRRLVPGHNAQNL